MNILRINFHFNHTDTENDNNFIEESTPAVPEVTAPKSSVVDSKSLGKAYQDKLYSLKHYLMLLPKESLTMKTVEITYKISIQFQV